MVVLVRKRKNVVRNTKQKENLVKNVRNLTSQVMRIFSFFFLFSISNIFSQVVESYQPTHQIGTEISFSYQIREIFHGFSYTQQFKKIALSTGLNLGVKSSYSQGAIFPQIHFKFAYLPLVKQNSKTQNTLFFGPQIQLKSAIQRVSKLHSYSDLLIGYDLSYGQKWRFYHALSCGPYLEVFKNDYRQTYYINSFNYYLTFGLNYAF